MDVAYSDVILPWSPGFYPSVPPNLCDFNLGIERFSEHWFSNLRSYDGKDTSTVDLFKSVEGKSRNSYNKKEKKKYLDELKQIYDNRIKPYDDVVMTRECYTQIEISLHSLPIYWAERVSPGLSVPPTQEISNLSFLLHRTEQYNCLKLWAKRFSLYFTMNYPKYISTPIKNRQNFIFDRRLQTFVDLQNSFGDLRRAIKVDKNVDIEIRHSKMVKCIKKLFDSIEEEFLAALFYSHLSNEINVYRDMKEDLKSEAVRLVFYETLQNFYENEVLDAYNSVANDVVIARADKDKQNILKAMGALHSKKDTTLFEDFNEFSIETDKKKRRTKGVNFTWPNQYKPHTDIPEDYDDLLQSYFDAERLKEKAVKGKQMNKLAHMVSKFISKKEKGKGIPHISGGPSLLDISGEYTPKGTSSLHDSGLNSSNKRNCSTSSSKPYTSTPKRPKPYSSRGHRVTFSDVHPDSSGMLSDLSILSSSDSEDTDRHSNDISIGAHKTNLNSSSKYDTAREELTSSDSETSEGSDSLSDGENSQQSDDSESEDFHTAFSSLKKASVSTSETESDRESLSSLCHRIETSSVKKESVASMLKKRFANLLNGTDTSSSKKNQSIIRSTNLYGAPNYKNASNQSINLNDIRRLTSKLSKKLDPVSDERLDTSLGKRFLNLSHENLTEDFHFNKMIGENAEGPKPQHSTPIGHKIPSISKNEDPMGLPFSIFRDPSNLEKKGSVPAELKDGRTINPKLLNIYKNFRGGDVGYEEEIIQFCDSVAESRTLPDTTFHQGPRLYKDMMSTYCPENLGMNKENVHPLDISVPELGKVNTNTTQNLINFTQPSVIINKEASKELTSTEKAAIVNSLEMLRRYKKKCMKALNGKIKELEKLKSHGIKKGVNSLYKEVVNLGEELDKVKAEMDRLSELGERVWTPPDDDNYSRQPVKNNQFSSGSTQPDLAQILNGVAESFGKSLEPLLGVDKVRPKPFSGRTIDFPRWLSLLMMAFKNNGYYRGEHAEIYKLMDLKNCIKHLGGYPNGNPVVNDILSLPLRKSNCAYALRKLISQYYDKSSMSKELKQEFRKNIIERKGRIDDRNYFCLKDILLKIDTHVSQLIKIGREADIAIPEADWQKIYVSMPDRMKENFVALKDEFIRENKPTRQQMEEAYLILYKRCLELALTKVVRMNKELGIDINAISRKKNVTSYVAGSKVFPKTKAKKRKSMNKIKKRIRDKNHPERVSSYFVRPKTRFKKSGSNPTKKFPLRKKRPTPNTFNSSRGKTLMRSKGGRPNFSNSRNSVQAPLYKERNKALRSMINSSFATETRPRSKNEKTPSYCYFCGKLGHLTAYCNVSNKTPKEKFQIVKQNNLCYNCLSKHPKNNCYTKLSCRKPGCTRLHHSSLHSYFVPGPSQRDSSKSQVMARPSKPFKGGMINKNQNSFNKNFTNKTSMKVGSNMADAKKTSSNSGSDKSKNLKDSKNQILNILKKISSRQSKTDKESSVDSKPKAKAANSPRKVSNNDQGQKNNKKDMSSFAPVYERPGKINWQTINDY